MSAAPSPTSSPPPKPQHVSIFHTHSSRTAPLDSISGGVADDGGGTKRHVKKMRKKRVPKKSQDVVQTFEMEIYPGSSLLSKKPPPEKTDGESLVSMQGNGCAQGCHSSESLGVQKCQVIQLILLSIIPMIALIIQNSTDLITLVASLDEAIATRDQVLMTSEIGRLLAELQQERAELGFCLFTTGATTGTASNTSRIRFSEANSTFPSDLPPSSSSFHRVTTATTIKTTEKIVAEGLQTSTCRITLSPRFQRTDTVIRNQSNYVSTFVPTALAIGEKRKVIFQMIEAGGATDDTILDELIWYSIANDAILQLLSQRIRAIRTTSVWKPLMAYMNVIKGIENYSISMIYGLFYFGTGSLSQNSFNKYLQFDSLAKEYLNATKSYSPDGSATWEGYISQKWNTEGNASGVHTLEERLSQRQIERATILRNLASESSANTSAANIYYVNMSEFVGELRNFQVVLKDLIEKQVAEDIASATLKQALAVIILFVVMIVCPVLLVTSRRVTMTIQDYAIGVREKARQLQKERQRADGLLEQMLPVAVVEELKKRKQVPAEYFQSVTIYFSDIVNFTKLSGMSSPMEIVMMLNSLYELFDAKLEKYDVYKVETIGDAYMVASGLPTRNGIQHAGQICSMSLDLMAAVKRFRIPHKVSLPLEIRVGINSGPCVAGVVGTKMPRYCLFGDTINVASRMETNGEPMRVHISDSTKQLLDEFEGYQTVSRGEIEIKGKGVMRTYWLIGRSQQSTLNMSKDSSELTGLGSFETKRPVPVPQFIHDIFGSEDSEEGILGGIGSGGDQPSEPGIGIVRPPRQDKKKRMGQKFPMFWRHK